MLSGPNRMFFGQQDTPEGKSVLHVLDAFGEIVTELVSKDRRLPATVRTAMPCSAVAVLTRDAIVVMAQQHLGMPKTTVLLTPDRVITTEEALYLARWEFGFDDPFVVTLPKALLSVSDPKADPTLIAVAKSHIQAELARVSRMTQIVPVNPVFGPVAFALDPRLAFTLMPFQDPLTRIYREIIKPTVERAGLVCKRADDYRSNRVVMQDIWKAICEARVVIADLTGLNPNVMYELGIAHTVGKTTILIFQKGSAVSFPFDLAHIRRIEYEDNAIGGKALETALSETLGEVLRPTAIS
jgi:hypothetical protein